MPCTLPRSAAALALSTIAAALVAPVVRSAPMAQPASGGALAARIDPYVPRQRLLVLTDIANEPDDQMSMVRLLVYANELDLEGLVATTSTWMRNKVRPDVILSVIDAYAQVHASLRHAPGFPEPRRCARWSSRGRPDSVCRQWVRIACRPGPS